MSNGEFESVLRAVGGVDKLIDWDGKDADIIMFDKDLNLTYVMQMGREVTNEL